MKYKQHRFDELISQYDSKILIREFAKLNQSIFNNKIKSGVPLITLNLKELNIKGFNDETFIVPHWTVRDIIIRIISRAFFDDYALIKKEINLEELVHLIGYYNNYDNAKSKDIKQTDIFYTLYGLAGQQFHSQVNQSIDNYKRNRILFQDINKSLGNIIDVEIPLISTLGMSYKDFRKLIAAMLIISTNEINILNYPKGYLDDLEIVDADIKYDRIAKYFTGTYKDIQDLDYNMARYLYPIIFDGINTTVIDLFMLEQKLYEGDYWLIRDFYNNNPHKSDANYFPNRFGIIFENYVEYILRDSSNCKYKHLTKDNYEEILKVSKKEAIKYADFILETPNYCLALEVKSAMQMPKAKDVYDNRASIMEFYKKTFEDGSAQALSTIKRYVVDGKIHCGIVVYYNGGFFKNFTKDTYLKDIKREDLISVLAIDITELEYLMKIIDKDIEMGERIINSFIEANLNKDNTIGLDLIYHINKFEPSHDSILNKYENFQM